MTQVPVSIVAEQLVYALNFSMVFAVLAGMLSVRMWDFITGLLWQWRAIRRCAAFRRRRLIREARFLAEYGQGRS